MNQRRKERDYFNIASALIVMGAIALLFMPLSVDSLRLVAICSCVIIGVVSSAWNTLYLSRKLKIALRGVSTLLTKVIRKGNASRALLAESGVFTRPTNNKLDSLVENARLSLGDTDGLVASVSEGINELVRLYELLTTNIAASVVIFDDKRRVTFCSAFTEFITGYSTDELLRSDRDILKDIVVDEDRERYLRAWNISRLGEDIHVRYQMLHKSGLRLWLETRFVPICNENGDPLAVMSVTMDLTDTLSYQKQIEEKNRDLQDFAYMVSHDLKAPIFTIKGMANALTEDYSTALGDDGRELLQYIIEGAERLERLVSSVLAYSRLATQQSKDGDVELNVVLSQVLQDFAQQIRDTNASIKIDSELPSVRGDQLRLYQVFSNLIGNAIKYRDHSRAPLITVKHRRAAGDKIIIDVADNGSGIPVGKLQDVFRPFHRAHGSEIEGSGIGLACVKKIVESYGGTVSVKSEEGKGSIFTVSLAAPPPKPQSIPEELKRVYEQGEHDTSDTPGR